MNEILRVELEAVRHVGNETNVVREEGKVDAYAVYIVTDANSHPAVKGCKAAKMFLPRFVAEFPSQEDAHGCAVALAASIGTVMQNNIPAALCYVKPAVEFIYEEPKAPFVSSRVFFYEHGDLSFDINDYKMGDHLKDRLRIRGMSRSSFAREMGMHILMPGTELTGNDAVCVMDGMSMRVFHFTPLVRVIQNGGYMQLVDDRTRELIQKSPAATMDDFDNQRAMAAFASGINA